MKLILALILGLTCAAPTFAQTNQPTVLEQAKQTVSTNLNEVIVDILRGVHSAGGEVYAASKTAITKSIDFTMEQAPLVVKEFLTWQFVKAAMWMIIFIIVPCLLFYTARQLKLYAKRETAFADDANIIKWIIRGVACLVLVVNLGVNGMTMAKIKVAPRVYLIEYVVDTIQGHNQSR